VAEPEALSSGRRGLGGLTVLGDRPPDRPVSDGWASDGPASEGPASDGPALDGRALDGRASDRELAEREAQFEAFVEKNSRELGRLAYLMVGDRDAADDLTADALLAAWRQWDTVRASDRPLAYLRRVVINMAATRVRRLVRERRWLVMFHSDAMEVAAGTDRADVVDVREALLRLPAGRRACVVLRYAFDLSEQEVAVLLGVSVGTVKSQTSKGAEQLRRGLRAPDRTIGAALGRPLTGRDEDASGSGPEGRDDDRPSS
jgi:RNA polymerase sigma-70 factor (sigma-E family)